MEYILYSEKLRKFYEFFEEEVNSAEEYLERLVEALPVVAEEMSLGKFDTFFDVPTTIYEVKGVSINRVLYTSPKGYGEECLKSEFETGDKGHIVVKMYPVKGYSWSEQEKEALKVFAMNTYFMCGRARLRSLMAKSEVTDIATGISNVVGFKKYAYKLMQKKCLHNYHGVRFDIKNFKIIIQTLRGTHVGKIFGTYARAIERFLGDNGKLATLGGDNFVVLIKDEMLDELIEFLDDVPVGITSTGNTVSISARIGVYDIKEKDDISRVMDYLDAAAKTARLQKKDVVYYKQEMLDTIYHDKRVIAEFPLALAKEEFVVYYQPKVDIKDNTLCGCEALVRWSKEGGIIQPLEFVPILEDSGLVRDLDYYVLETACQDIVDWIKRGIEPARVSVNFSRIHLKNKGAAEKILYIIEGYGVDPSLIEIELTEMSGYDNFYELNKFINKLKAQGVRVSIDDFGTGYSSLNMLTEVDADIIKLDRMLTKCIDAEYSKTKLMLLNIVDMVHKLNFKSLAEGVETDEQLRFLKNIGCTMVQGFIFDEPMPKEEFEKRLTGVVTYNI